MSTKPGTLIAIGGKEDKEGDREILQELARRVGKGRLVITAIASLEPEILLSDYKKIFRSLGVKDVAILEVHSRAEAADEKKLEALNGAAGVFFTGGDQLRITSQFGGTLICDKIFDIYREQGVIAGTSAGASVMCATMLVEGKGAESPKAGGIKMAAGLGLIDCAIIDQHFAERGRMGRLLCAVAENPRLLGIGIDEDTAIVVEGGTEFTVFGKGAVYVMDASSLSFSNIAEEKPNETLSIHNVTLHVLSGGDKYNIEERQPLIPSEAVAPDKKPAIRKSKSKKEKGTRQRQITGAVTPPKKSSLKAPIEGLVEG